MERVLIAGTSGSGKSRLAAELARRLGLPYVELDSLFHGPNWVPRPEFGEDVRRLAAEPRWVSEWQYELARSVLLQRADTLIWLDFGRPSVMHRVLRRSFRRAALGEPIFNGNTEGFRDWLDPSHPVRWAWRTHARLRPRVLAALEQRPDLTVIRLSSPAEIRRWLRSVGRS